MIRPLGKYVLVRPDEKAKVTKGGIHIPDAVEGDGGPPARIATVEAIGDDVSVKKAAFEPPLLAVGDRVLISRHSAPEKVPGTKFLLVPCGDLIGVVPPEAAIPDVPDPAHEDIARPFRV